MRSPSTFRLHDVSRLALTDLSPRFSGPARSSRLAPNRFALAAIAAGVSVGAGFLLVLNPLAIAPLVTGAVLVLAVRVDVKWFVLGLLCYLPLEPFVLSRLPDGASAAVRYAPELLSVAVAGAVLVRRRGAGLRPLAPLLCLIVAFGALAVISGLAAGLDPSRIVVGLRGELRYAPLLVIAAASVDAARDARLFARCLLAAGLLQVAVCGVQWVGGASARAFFASNFDVTLGGVKVSSAAGYRPGTLFGTLGHYNQLAAFLVVVLAVCAAAGARTMGMNRRVFWLALGALAATVVASGSREGLLALLAAGLAIAGARLRLFATWALLVFGIGFLTVVGPTQGTLSRGPSSPWQRVAAFADPATYSLDDGSNFRILLLDTEVRIVRRHGVFLGRGPGTIVDPRAIADRSSPLYESAVGRTAIANSYRFDGNWGLILVEFGVVGVLLIFGILYSGLRLAARERRTWLTSAVAGIVAAVFVLGWFASVLQARAPTAVLWAFVGLAGAAMQGLERSDSAR